METLESLAEAVKFLRESTLKLNATILEIGSVQRDIIKRASVMDAELQVLQEELAALKKGDA
jgi:prefoldin subunit 5